MRRLKSAAFLLVGLVIALVFAAALQEPVRRVVLIPVEYIIWAIRILYQSLPGALWWSLLLFILFLVTLQSLPLKALRLPGTRPAPPWEYPGEASRWARSLLQAETSDFFKWRLAAQLAHLAARLLSTGEEIEESELKGRLLRGQLILPEHVRAYLLAGLELEPPIREPGLFDRLLGRQPPSPLDVSVAEVVDALERGAHAPIIPTPHE